MSVVTKGFLLVVIVDDFTNALTEVKQGLAKEFIANQLRRAVSKYIINKVRTPRLDFMSEKLNNG